MTAKKKRQPTPLTDRQIRIRLNGCESRARAALNATADVAALRARLDVIEKRLANVESNLPAGSLGPRLAHIERSLPDGTMSKRVGKFEERLASVERDVGLVAQRQQNPPHVMPLNMDKRLDMLDAGTARQAEALAELAARVAQLEDPPAKQRRRWLWV